jgi:hypothetical protein
MGGMTKIHGSDFGQWCGARECTIPKQILRRCSMFNVGDRRGVDRGRQRMDERPKPVIGGGLPPGSCPGSGEHGRWEEGTKSSVQEALEMLIGVE